mmetsp:Transcript_14265/g.33766  ORF Transcript_14265/g.33766 Transcript_14265/m.33766 type:complete len:441 (-) Transcript_14265:73-1395(-)
MQRHRPRRLWKLLVRVSENEPWYLGVHLPLHFLLLRLFAQPLAEEQQLEQHCHDGGDDRGPEEPAELDGGVLRDERLVDPGSALLWVEQRLRSPPLRCVRRVHGVHQPPPPCSHRLHLRQTLIRRFAARIHWGVLLSVEVACYSDPGVQNLDCIACTEVVREVLDAVQAPVRGASARQRPVVRLLSVGSVRVVDGDSNVGVELSTPARETRVVSGRLTQLEGDRFRACGVLQRVHSKSVSVSVPGLHPQRRRRSGPDVQEPTVHIRALRVCWRRVHDQVGRGLRTVHASKRDGDPVHSSLGDCVDGFVASVRVVRDFRSLGGLRWTRESSSLVVPRLDQHADAVSAGPAVQERISGQYCEATDCSTRAEREEVALRQRGRRIRASWLDLEGKRVWVRDAELPVVASVFVHGVRRIRVHAADQILVLLSPSAHLDCDLVAG